ncbi:MAG: TetR family transcriptional regulator C-terminal domain-containing protein [Firmicutes bacterium]|nr:TetR family transcriptional regulator C-terminal domain-containing protein [Bacillota bacterium]
MKEEGEARYHARFLVAGFNAIVALWIVNGCKESPEYMSELLSKEYRVFYPE